MTLVPRQPLGSFASAIAGQLRSHMDRCGQGCATDHKLRGNDQIAALSGEEREAPTSPADILDASQSSHKRIWNAKGFQHFSLLDHANILRMRPRADRALVALLRHYASGSIYGYPTAVPLDLTKVNAVEQFAGVSL